ncbi:MAG: ferrous iron transport protein A [Pirellulaceae bacterium]|nr:ferrous iron transport protein A [Pirellulaceae bacterium]
MQTLDRLAEGQVARIVAIHGDDPLAMRLMEMGLLDDERVRMLGFAPLGDPLEIEIRGYRLSLRIREAQRVEVEPLPSDPAA